MVSKRSVCVLQESESAAEETDSGAGSIVERDLSTPTPGES